MARDTICKVVDQTIRGQSTAGPVVLMLCMFAGGALYGAAMASFGGFSMERLLLMLYGSMKVPLLLLGSFILALPSFFVINTLLGVRRDFPYVLRSLCAAQAVMTLTLASLSPYTLFWYVCSSHYQVAVAFNGFVFLLAAVVGQFALRRDYRSIIARNARHGLLLRVWLVLYSFVAIQLAWLMRPFIGEPESPALFFRPDSWGNAYVAVWRLVTHAIFR